MLKRLRLWIGLLVSLGFLFLFFHNVPLSGVHQALQQAEYLYLPGAVAIYFLAVVVRAWRWQLLLAPFQRFSIGGLFPIVVIGYMANDVLPIRAGELIRAWLLGRQGRCSASTVLATILVERTFDGLALLSFIFAFSLFFPLVPWLRQVLTWGAVLFGGGLALLLGLGVWGAPALAAAQRLLRPLPLPWRERLGAWVALFGEGLRALRSPGRLVAVFVASLLTWATETAMYGMVGLALGLGLPLHPYFLVAAVANLSITLPSSQGGVGPFEYFAAQTLLLFGVEAGLATAYVLVLHALLLVPVSLLGLYYLWFLHLSLKELSRAPATGMGVPRGAPEALP